MQSGNGVGDGEAKAVAGCTPRSVQAPERAQHLGDLAIGYAGTVVGDRHRQRVGLLGDRNIDTSVLTGVFERVLNQVGERTRQQVGVTGDQRFSR